MDRLQTTMKNALAMIKSFRKIALVQFIYHRSDSDIQFYVIELAANKNKQISSNKNVRDSKQVDSVMRFRCVMFIESSRTR